MLRLDWARNDGLGGHVFLGLADLERLAAEMTEQGMTGWLSLDRLEPGATIPAGAIDLALSQASSEPTTLDDAKFWRIGSASSPAPPRTAASSSDRAPRWQDGEAVGRPHELRATRGGFEPNPERGGSQMSPSAAGTPRRAPESAVPADGRRRTQPLEGWRDRGRSRRTCDRPLRRAPARRRGRDARHDGRRRDDDARDNYRGIDDGGSHHRRDDHGGGDHDRSRPAASAPRHRGRPQRAARRRRQAHPDRAGRAGRADRALRRRGRGAPPRLRPGRRGRTGQPARISFRADDVGEFELELEERGVPIAELVVS